MLRRIIALLLMVSLITTCVNLSRHPSPTHSYNVHIRDGFSDEQKQSIIKGFREWESATCNTVIFNQIENEDRSISLIVVAPTTREDMNKIHDGKIGWVSYHGSDTDILIVTDLDHHDFYQTVIHEFGHALGLNHEENLHYSFKTTMMEHSGNSIAMVTCHDLITFCQIWNCNAFDFTRCKEARPQDLE